MDWKRIEHRLMGRLADDNRRPEVARSRDLLKRVRKHQKLLKARWKLAHPRVVLTPPQTRQWAMMRHALAQGHKIISFDAEWQYQWPNKITELGVAIYHQGHREMHNIRVRAGAGKAESITRFMTDPQAKRWMASVFDGAGLLIGHAIQNDRKKLREWGWPLPEPEVLPCVDTEKWSRSLNAAQDCAQKLTTFCRNYGIETHRAHVAGNDALMTLEVALHLASIEEDHADQAA